MGTPGLAGLIFVNLLGCLLVLGDGAKSGDISWFPFFFFSFFRGVDVALFACANGTVVPRCRILDFEGRLVGRQTACLMWYGDTQLCLTASTGK